MADGLKMVFVGDGAVGKTSVIQHLSQDHAPHSMFQEYNVTRSVKGGKAITLHMGDTGGEDDYAAQRGTTYSDSSLVIICFSVISPQSFENVKQKWLPEIHRNRPGIPVLLVATKTDLREDPEILARLQSRGMTPVTSSNGKSLAKDIGAISYLEVSIRDEKNLGKFCEELTNLLYKTAMGAKGQNGCEIV